MQWLSQLLACSATGAVVCVGVRVSKCVHARAFVRATPAAVLASVRVFRLRCVHMFIAPHKEYSAFACDLAQYWDAPIKLLVHQVIVCRLYW